MLIENLFTKALAYFDCWWCHRDSVVVIAEKKKKPSRVYTSGYVVGKRRQPLTAAHNEIIISTGVTHQGGNAIPVIADLNYPIAVISDDFYRSNTCKNSDKNNILQFT